jgi:[ribosomal protein S5]-alanine N-acetyltransferase
MTTSPDILQGTRIRLRRSAASDTMDIFLIASDPDVTRYMDWPMQQDITVMQARRASCDARWESGEEYHWVIEGLDSGGVLGCMSCRVRGHQADFGFFLARNAWGLGFATEAATLLVAWLKAQPGIFRIWATTDVENARSCRVLEKAGLVREGILHKATVRPNMEHNIPRDTVLYACWETAPDT